MEKVSLSEKLARIQEHWKPGLVARVNESEVKLAKIRGSFEWHHHAESDELFLVLEGRIRLEIRGREPVELGQGELLVVPAGVEHRPVAAEEAQILMIEAQGTLNTGNLRNERTVAEPVWL